MAEDTSTLDSKLIDQGESKGEGKSWFKRTFAPMGPGSVRGSAFNLSSSVMGSGLLSFPYAISVCGLATGTVLLLVCGGAFMAYFMFIVMGCEKFQCYTYVGVMEASYGKFGKKLTEITVLFLYFGGIASLQVIISNFACHGLYEMGVVEQPKEFMVHLLCLTILNLVIFLPLSLQKDLYILQYLALLGLVCYVYLNLLVIVMSPWYIDENFNSEDLVYANWNPVALDAAAILFYGYSGAGAVPLFYNELNERNTRRGFKVIIRSFIFLIVFYAAIGILGYLSFPLQVPDMIVYRPPLHGIYDWPMLVARMLIIITFIVLVPLSMQPLRLATEQLWGGSEFKRNETFFYFTTVVFLVVPWLIAVFVPSVLDYFRVLGGLFAVIGNIILPTMLFWKFSESYIAIILVTLMSTVLSLLGFACVANMIYEAAS